MPYVEIPKDLTEVKTKIIGPFTKRQVICLPVAAAIGIPIYFGMRGVIGNETAMIVSMIMMSPAMIAMIYKKDGQNAEIVLRNIIRSQFYFPQQRKYRQKKRGGRT